MKKLLKKLLKLVPGLGRLIKDRDILFQEKDEMMDKIKSLQEDRERLIEERNNYTRFVYPGHFYSPFPNLDDIHDGLAKPVPGTIPGIQLNEEDQVTLLKSLKEISHDIPFKKEKSDDLRFYFDNPYYSAEDAVILFCMIKYNSPKRFIEIGSGYSSCVTLDTNELFFDSKIKCTFIDPDLEILKSNIKQSDKSDITLRETKLQDIPLDLFRTLEKNDILFIDSSHVSKINSDVNYLIHEILPALQPGVYIHFHDIFYPFEYPENWLRDGRAWNEAYILRAFLEFNSRFKIVLFPSYLEHAQPGLLNETFPEHHETSAGSIWLKSENKIDD